MMVMDKSSGGLAGRLALFGSASIGVLAVLGFVYSFSSRLTEIDNKLDRNCRTLVTIQANSRFLILEHENPGAASTLRHIFKDSAIESCG